jgi:hypothetical protein
MSDDKKFSRPVESVFQLETLEGEADFISLLSIRLSIIEPKFCLGAPLGRSVRPTGSCVRDQVRILCPD